MNQNSQNEFQFLMKALSYLRTHWWLFALEVVVVSAIWMTKFYRTPNVYESRAQVLIDSSTREMYRSVFSGAARNRGNRRQNMVHVLRSPEVMDRFTKSLGEFFKKEGRPAHLRMFFPSGQLMPSSAFTKWISLSWNRSSDIYGVRCIATNPDAAHDICKVYLSTLKSAYPKFGQRAVQNKRDFMARQISSLHRQIVDRELHLAEFEKEHTDYIQFRTAIIENKSLQNLRNRLLELEHRVRLNRSIRKLLLRNGRAEFTTGDSFRKTHTILQERLSDLIYKRHLTEQLKTPAKASRLAEIQRDIDSVKRQLAMLNEQENGKAAENFMPKERRLQMLADLEVQYSISRIKLKNLRKEVDEIEIQKSKYRQTDLEYNRLNSELKHKTRLLASLYKKEQETEIELSAVRSEIFKLQRPSRSGHRVEPQLSKHVFAAISLSIFVVLMTALLLTLFFPRLDSEAEVARLNLPILGKVPVFKDWLGKSNQLSPFALEYLKIMSYRILRETKAQKCPVIIVTSPQAGEGKSTVTYFLSIASQSPEKRCLFIDGDMITSHPNQFFGINEDRTKGLRAVLEDGVKDTKDLIVETQHPGVHFMPRGGKIESISSPDYLKPVGDMLERLKKEYDIIFIDTPPLFASSLAHQWAGLASLIVLVARMYLTQPKDVIEGLQTCKVFSKAPVGVALNCLPMYRQPGRGSYYYYFSRYYSRKSSRRKAA